jgi:hypothetical protein
VPAGRSEFARSASTGPEVADWLAHFGRSGVSGPAIQPDLLSSKMCAASVDYFVLGEPESYFPNDAASGHDIRMVDSTWSVSQNDGVVRARSLGAAALCGDDPRPPRSMSSVSSDTSSELDTPHPVLMELGPADGSLVNSDFGFDSNESGVFGLILDGLSVLCRPEDVLAFHPVPIGPVVAPFIQSPASGAKFLPLRFLSAPDTKLLDRRLLDQYLLSVVQELRRLCLWLRYSLVSRQPIDVMVDLRACLYLLVRLLFFGPIHA